MSSSKNIRSVFDPAMVKRCTEELFSYEKLCSHSGFADGAAYCCRALRDAGFEQVELIEHQADGITSAFDCTMPPAWELEKRSFLRIDGEDTILADSDKIPFAVSPWSPPTPPEGITAELIAVQAGDDADVRNKWVLLLISDGKNPQGEFLEQLRQKGAVGVVAVDFLSGKDYPDSLRWFNGTGRFGWYPIAGDKRLPLFSISGDTARMLLKRLETEKISLHGVMNTRIYSGKIYTVTGVIPGKSAHEYALFSHIYEPFAADNAIGFGAVCAIGKAIKECYGTPERSLRAVFSMELYGFAAYLSAAERANKIAGALNMDAVNHKKARLLTFADSPVCAPWFADWVLPEFLSSIPDTKFIRQAGNLSDDTFSGDPLCGNVPVNWCKNPSGTAHHCGCTDFEPDWQWAEESLPLFAEAIAKMVQFSADDARLFPGLAEAEFREQSALILQSAKTPAEKRLLLERCWKYLDGRAVSAEKYCNTTLDKSALEKLYIDSCKAVKGETVYPETEAAMAEIFPLRTSATAFSLAKIPDGERQSFRLPRLLYSLFDGKTSLLEAFQICDWFLNTNTSCEDMRNELDRLKYLEKYNYVILKNQRQSTERKSVL